MPIKWWEMLKFILTMQNKILNWAQHHSSERGQVVKWDEASKVC